MGSYIIPNVKKARNLFGILLATSVLFGFLFVFKSFQPSNFYRKEIFQLEKSKINSKNGYSGRLRFYSLYYLDLKFKNLDELYTIYLGNNLDKEIEEILKIEDNKNLIVTTDKLTLPRFDGKNASISKIEYNGIVIYKENQSESIRRAKIMFCIALLFLVFFIWMFFLYRNLVKN